MRSFREISCAACWGVPNVNADGPRQPVIRDDQTRKGVPQMITMKPIVPILGTRVPASGGAGQPTAAGFYGWRHRPTGFLMIEASTTDNSTRVSEVECRPA